MARLPRKLIGVVILLVILINVWMLSRKHLPRNFELAGNGPSYEESGTPDFDSHHKGDSWSKGSGKDDAKSDKYSDSTDPAKADPVKGDAKTDKTGGSAANQSPAQEAGKGKGGKTSGKGTPNSPENYDKGMAAIKSVLDAIAQIEPGVNSLTGADRYNRDIKSDSGLHDNELPPTSTVMSLYLKIADDEVERLKRSHAAMFAKLPKSLPENSVQGRGIVMTGGGKYFPMVLTAVRWLRENDKTTPIEVFMADSSEYESHICDNLFPKLNVECRVIQDIYGKKLSEKLDSKYALKPLAILASRFDDIYFMDADSYPMFDVNTIFDWSVYEELGMVLNADYWPRYISPKFYDIVGISLGGRARGDPNSDALLQSDREHAIPGKSTESGQVFVRKSQHIQSLMLAMYYNLFGPDVYFPLLMQNGHGEGDKDTYAAAAIICGEGYYQTQRRPVTLGHHNERAEYKGYAMVQPDPISDYERHVNGLDVPEKFFALHANSVKANLKFLLTSYDEQIRGAPPLRQQRFFGNMDNVRHEILEDFDIEQHFFHIMESVACEWVLKEGYQPRDWDTADVGRLCRLAQKHVQWLKANPDVAAPANAKYWIDDE